MPMSRRGSLKDGLFPPEIIAEFFERHLPYRLSQLNAQYRWKKELRHLVDRGDHERHAPTHVECSAMMARAFLQFLGIGLDHRGSNLIRYKNRPDDVRATDLGGALVDLDDPSVLSARDRDTIVQLLLQANKTTVHFTFSDIDADGWKCLPQACSITLRLLRTHLYVPAKQPMTERWRKPRKLKRGTSFPIPEVIEVRRPRIANP